MSFHEHESLLDHKVEEELSESERKAAWAEYKAEVIPPSCHVELHLNVSSSRLGCSKSKHEPWFCFFPQSATAPQPGLPELDNLDTKTDAQLFVSGAFSGNVSANLCFSKRFHV